MALLIQGTIKLIKDVQQVSDKFKKREFVIEYAANPMYPQFIQFQLIQDKVELIDFFTEGQEIKVEFDLRGREWTNPQGEVKYFNSLDAWRLSPIAENTVEPEKKSLSQSAQTVVSDQPRQDLPF